MKQQITFKSRYQVLFYLVILFFLIPFIGNAQPGLEDDVRDLPVDGGLSLLVAAGAAYGAKKVQQRKRNIKK
ncbi:MAG: hypothetical protein EAY72_02735 [Bacteroidetes bacterium]|nr:MAG: hypothetical protein EAY72_02735 [Bacteroidota bacterium]